MLNADTQRRIDTCRDLLVGETPDPVAQVGQIILALLYKFLDNQDARAEAQGRARHIFTGEFARYRWPRLLSPALNGRAMRSLYRLAIEQLRAHPQLPAPFRAYFQRADPPCRDPDTLRGMLSEIDGFTPDHPERLADAFEYLLLALSRPGHAGRLHTPRHLVDFMVAAVNPQPHERILDPACGTATFLAAAWQHLTRGRAPGSPPPDARLEGTERSPDIARLAWLHLALRGLEDPRILEYDPLARIEHWNTRADVILTNSLCIPPGERIGPQGWLIDGIARRLTPTGRAAIIVPETVLHHDRPAYRALREQLVRQSLIGVVSLPTRMFGPCSHVKTALLLLDPARARQRNTVLFVKIEHDGFSPDAARRPIAHDDLPAAQRAISAFLHAPQTFEDSPLAHAMPRESIGARGAWRLTGARGAPTRRALVRIADLCEIDPPPSELAQWPGQTEARCIFLQDLRDGAMDCVPQARRPLADILRDAYLGFRDDDVLLAKTAPRFGHRQACRVRGLGNVPGFCPGDFFVLRPGARLLPALLRHLIASVRFEAAAQAAMPGSGLLRPMPRAILENLRIPAPALDVQREIIADIARCQRVIDGARQVVESYPPSLPATQPPRAAACSAPRRPDDSVQVDPGRPSLAHAGAPTIREHRAGFDYSAHPAIPAGDALTDQAIVDANRILIERFEARIQSVLDRLWNRA